MVEAYQRKGLRARELVEAKDNALMTALMNSVVNNNVAAFSYLFFGSQEERGFSCGLNHVDINGNTILHLAAKNNALNIVKLLKHIYIEAAVKKDPFITSLLENDET
jgi:ankyrin repeat protein